MTETQIVSLAITIFAIAAGSLFNNVRISDSATGLNKRIDDTKEVLRAESRAEFGSLRAEMNMRFTAIDRKLDEILRIVGDHETRIGSLEQRPR